MIKLTLIDKLHKAESNFFKLKSPLLDRAAKRAIRVASKSTLGYTAKQLKGEVNLKLSEIKQEHLWLSPVYGKKIKDMVAFIHIKPKTINLYQFVVGNKKPRKQKGIKVKRRKPIKVRYKKGKTETRPALFIAKVKGRYMLLNRLANKKRKRLKRGWQKGPTARHELKSYARFIERDTKMQERIMKHSDVRLIKEFDRAVERALAKLS